MLHRITVLHRQSRLLFGRMLGFQRPVRFAQQFTSDQHQVGVAAADDLVSLLRIRDQPDRAGQDAGVVADAALARKLAWVSGALNPAANRLPGIGPSPSSWRLVFIVLASPESLVFRLFACMKRVVG